MKKETIYVSWGGTGRGAAVREAVLRAGEAGQNLRYLAILDEKMFGDINTKLEKMVQSELAWLLHAQLRMINLQTEPDVRASVDIRGGDIEGTVIEVARSSDADLILLGAPLGSSYHQSGGQDINALVETLRQETGADVEIIGNEM